MTAAREQAARLHGVRGMSRAPIYYIEPQWEPDGQGRGWDLAPTDSAATVFCIVRREVTAPAGEEAAYESIVASETSRRAAAAVIARLTAARRMEDERPPPPVPVPQRSMVVRFLMGIPVVLALWLLAGWINRIT